MNLKWERVYAADDGWEWMDDLYVNGVQRPWWIGEHRATKQITVSHPLGVEQWFGSIISARRYVEALVALGEE